MTIYFSISGETSLERTKDREIKDAFDDDEHLINNLDDAYKFWFEKTKLLFPDRRLIMVNGEQSIDRVTAEMYDKLARTIKNNYQFFKP